MNLLYILQLVHKYRRDSPTVDLITFWAFFDTFGKSQVWAKWALNAIKYHIDRFSSTDVALILSKSFIDLTTYRK